MKQGIVIKPRQMSKEELAEIIDWAESGRAGEIEDFVEDNTEVLLLAHIAWLEQKAITKTCAFLFATEEGCPLLNKYMKEGRKD